MTSKPLFIRCDTAGKRQERNLPASQHSIFSHRSVCVGVRTHVQARLVAQFCLTLCDPMDSSPPGYPCPWGFSSQEHCSGLPCPPPGELPDPRIEPRSPIFQVDSLQSEPPRKPSYRRVHGNDQCPEA